MNEQKPSPGRIVRYVDHDGKTLPAVITRVRPDGNVDLHVLHENTLNIPESDANASAIRSGTWHWPRDKPSAAEIETAFDYGKNPTR
jgi:hypothetical protein